MKTFLRIEADAGQEPTGWTNWTSQLYSSVFPRAR